VRLKAEIICNPEHRSGVEFRPMLRLRVSFLAVILSFPALAQPPRGMKQQT
jgi:hypothetical protein